MTSISSIMIVVCSVIRFSKRTLSMSCLRFGVFRRKVVAKTRVVMPDGVKNVLVVVFLIFH